MNKKEVFKTELDNMKSTRIRKSAETFIEMLPDYFFTTAASSTGKYHPAFASGDGGLVRHTKVACYILNEILSKNTNKPLDIIEKDTDRDYIMTADEAVEYGMIDKVITLDENN